MGICLSMLVAVTSMLAVNSPPQLQEPTVGVIDVGIIAHIMFDLDMASFTRQYRSLHRTYPQLDWATDGCSAPVVGDSGRSFNFRMACTRHDFGYRNYKALGAFTTEIRSHLDQQFRLDLDASCKSQVRTFKVRCVAWAEIFFAAVRAAGGP